MKGAFAMLKKAIALALILSLLLTALPAALASNTVSAKTPLNGASENKRTNIRLAAQAIDGTLVPAGKRFSFNDVVGPRTERRGYRTAPNGRDVKVTGGGVAQVASTLYLALLKLGNDVRIDPVKTYGNRFVEDYVANVDQAIITDYDAGIDLSFVNLGDDISIDMWASDDAVWCILTTGGGSAFSFLGDDAEPEGDSEDEDDDYDDDGGIDVFLPLFTVAPTANPERTLLADSAMDCGDDVDVLHNVGLAADCVNDTVLKSGDIFSFNDVVGPRTKKYGYRRAVNGRGAKVTGGGVAQVATALWLAIKDEDDFSVVEKSTYGKKYNQHYVKSSADAILTDYSSGRDFSFRYTGTGSVTIYTYVDDGWLYCEIYES